MPSSRFAVLLLAGCSMPLVWAQTDWPVYGHDSGAMRYSPLKQITPKNVARLKVAGTFDTQAPINQPAAPPAAVSSSPPGAPGGGAAPRRPVMRRTEVTPLVIGNVMYLCTGYNRVLALDASTGEQIW